MAAMESIGLGLVLAFMAIGLIGAFVPLIPGAFLVWLSVALYVFATDFSTITPTIFGLITVIALVSSTADIWLSILGAKVGGAGLSSLKWGFLGAVLGLIVLNLLGALIGYALGILFGEYRQRGDWGAALKAGIGGLAGWGISSLVEVAGAMTIIAIFVWKVVTAS
ncbi:MAG: DUF456 domain-containing protein [Acidobacteriota bacterium]